MNNTLVDIDYSQAACATVKDPEIFWPKQTTMYYRQVADAKLLCERCPVIQECLQHALKHEPDGVWGGTTPNERNAMRRKLRIPLERIHPR